MKRKDNYLFNAAELRRQEKAQLSAERSAIKKLPFLEDTERLVHELQVHQIELEMQNDELRRVHKDLEVSRACYFDLYDLAPVGYLSLSEKGLILEANLTAASLLGIARGGLVNQQISRYIFKDDQDIYDQHRLKLLEVGMPCTCELRMTKPDGSFLWVMLNSTASRNADGALVSYIALSDITDRMNMHSALEEKNKELKLAAENIHTLAALLPICMHCKKIRDDKGYWEQIETYIAKHSDTSFSHGICDDCLNKFYPEQAKMMGKEKP